MSDVLHGILDHSGWTTTHHSRLNAIYASVESLPYVYLAPTAGPLPALECNGLSRQEQ